MIMFGNCILILFLIWL